MAGFWYPYAGFVEARSRLIAFANATVGPQCGVSFSDGASINVIRPPSGTGSTWQWLNILTQHVAAPSLPPPTSRGRWGRLKGFFWHAMEIQGEAALQTSQAQLAMGQMVDQTVETHIWLPVHEFLLRHKLLADGVGVALDVVGVLAGTVFVITALPEIAGATVVVGTAGLVTGLSAAAGSFLLLLADGSVFGLEVSGNKGLAESVESNKTVQWMQIGATVMVLPDVAVGGIRALREIGQLGNEGREAGTASAAAARNVEAARARMGKIAKPPEAP